MSSPQDLPTLGTAVGGGGRMRLQVEGGRSERMRAERVVAHRTDYLSLDGAVMIHTSLSAAQIIPSYGLNARICMTT